MSKKSARRIEFLRQTFLYEQDDKPGSVANGHLSRPAVAGRLQRLTRKQTGRLMLSVSLASDGVYMCPGRYRPGGSLLHCPSNLTVNLVPLLSFRYTWFRLDLRPYATSTNQAVHCPGSS